MFNKFYWSEALRDWGNAERVVEWVRRDQDIDWRLRMEMHRAEARFA